MIMRVVFCIYNFSENKLFLQPWLTFIEVGQGLINQGHEVYILTDIEFPARPDRFNVQTVKSLRNTNKKELAAKIKKINPHTLVFMPTPLNLVTFNWLKNIFNCRWVAFLSYPFYSPKELCTAWLTLKWADVRDYVRHMFIPKMVWWAYLRRNFHAIISQSESTLEKIKRNASKGSYPALHFIAPGIDLSKWPLSSHRPVSPLKLLYLGTASAIRGFYVLIDAVAAVNKPAIKVRVLARGADQQELNNINAAIKHRRLEDRVSVRGGYLAQNELVKEIQSASVVITPFILVPSDLPVSVMEAIACGTPVIGTQINGLPSAIGRAGSVAKQADAVDLAKIIMEIDADPDLLGKWHEGCVRQRNQMADWKTVAAHWEKVLFNAG